MPRRADWMHHPKIIRQLPVPGLPGILQLRRYNQTGRTPPLEDPPARGRGIGDLPAAARDGRPYVVGDRA